MNFSKREVIGLWIFIIGQGFPVIIGLVTGLARMYSKELHSSTFNNTIFPIFDLAISIACIISVIKSKSRLMQCLLIVCIISIIVDSINLYMTTGNV